VSDTGSPLLRRRDGDVLTVTFNRPAQLNAMTFEMESMLEELCASVNQDDSLRAVIFTGATGRRPAFIAGQDVGELSSIADAEAARALEERSEEVLAAVESITVPTIAAVAGPCVGVGALVAASCDLMIVADSVIFGFPIARTVGIMLSTKNLARIIDLVGVPRTKRMILRARLMNAEELESSGAVMEVTDDEMLLTRASAIAEEISHLAPLTLSGTKASIGEMRDAALSADNERLLTAAYLSADFAEGVDAFLQKRPPVWTGR
jgi:enoyl-CoA hydratase